MKVTNWSLRCGFLLGFGLCLYLLDIGLHLGLAAKYLTMQGCYRSVSHTFSNFKLNDLVDLENLTENLNSKGNCFPIFLSQPRLCPDYYYYLSYYSSRASGFNQVWYKKEMIPVTRECLVFIDTRWCTMIKTYFLRTLHIFIQQVPCTDGATIGWWTSMPSCNVI